MFFKETIEEATKYMGPQTGVGVVGSPNRVGNILGLKKDDGSKDDEKPEDIFKPPQKDSLFWCYYILSRGAAAYETIGNRHFTVEHDEKFKLVELVRSKKPILKRYKMTLSSIENDLTNSATISLPTFFAICVASDLTLLYVDKINSTFLKIGEGEEGKGEEGVEEEEGEEGGVSGEISLLCRSNVSQRYECKTRVDPSTTRTIEKTYFKLFSMNKPLQAVSAYKVQEILDICAKMHINVHANGTSGKTHPKQYLYDALKHKLTN